MLGLPKWLRWEKIHLPMQGTQFLSLSREDPLEGEMASHCTILAWKNPMDRGTWQAMVHGIAKSRTQLSDLEQHWRV